MPDDIRFDSFERPDLSPRHAIDRLNRVMKKYVGNVEQIKHVRTTEDTNYIYVTYSDDEGVFHTCYIQVVFGRSRNNGTVVSVRSCSCLKHSASKIVKSF